MSLILKILIIVMSSSLLLACGEKTDLSTPAQSSIDEYNSKLEECADKKEDSSDEQTKTIQKNSIINKVANSPFEIKKDDMVLGNPDAKVTIIEYFSPTCPHCAYFHKNTFAKIKEQYINTGKIAYVTREFVGNKQDLDAAVLARCSQNKDDFYKFTDVILSQQDSWAANNKYKEILTNIGQLGGLSPERYAACLNDDQLVSFLINSTQMISKIPKFVGTPAFFINGIYFTNPYTFEALAEAIEETLHKQSELNQNSESK